MLIALCLIAATVVLLALHLIAVPLSKGRPVLLRGAEPAVALALFLVCLSALWPFLWSLLILQLLAGVAWRPWIVVGVGRDAIQDAITRAASMVRFRVDRSDATYSLPGAGSASLVSVGRGIHCLAFRVKRTPKLALFQNVLRKTIQNFTLAPRVSSTLSEEKNGQR